MKTVTEIVNTKLGRKELLNYFRQKPHREKYCFTLTEFCPKGFVFYGIFDCWRDQE